MVTGTGAFLRRWASSELLCSRRRCPLMIPAPHPVASLFSTTAITTTSAAEPGPPPIRVAITHSAGRGVFATRPIRAGDLIHTAQPLLTHPAPSLPHPVCYYCLRKLGNEASPVNPSSSNSNLQYFCSESCQDHSKVFYEVERRVDWSLYDDHCREQGLKYPFMLKRLACMVLSGAASADSLDILQRANLLPETIVQMEKEFSLLKCSLMEAHIEDTLLAFLTKEWYVGVLARIRINSFRIELVGGLYEDLLASAAASFTCEAAVGNAVYMLPSFYNHDCDPNAHIIWMDNADAKMKALRDIEEDEEVCICYIDASMGYDARQRILAEGFGFQCRCPRCLAGE